MSSEGFKLPSLARVFQKLKRPSRTRASALEVTLLALEGVPPELRGKEVVFTLDKTVVSVPRKLYFVEPRSPLEGSLMLAEAARRDSRGAMTSKACSLQVSLHDPSAPEAPRSKNRVSRAAVVATFKLNATQVSTTAQRLTLKALTTTQSKTELVLSVDVRVPTDDTRRDYSDDQAGTAREEVAEPVLDEATQPVQSSEKPPSSTSKRMMGLTLALDSLPKEEAGEFRDLMQDDDDDDGLADDDDDGFDGLESEEPRRLLDAPTRRSLGGLGDRSALFSTTAERDERDDKARGDVADGEDAKSSSETLAALDPPVEKRVAPTNGPARLVPLIGRQNDRGPPLMHVNEFTAWLRARNVDLNLFGHGETKSVNHLMHELREGTSALEEQETDGEDVKRVVRVVRSVWMTLRHGYKVLIVRQQSLADGRVRVRNGSHGSHGVIPSRGLRVAEEWQRAALALLEEELGLRSTQVLLADDSVRAMQKTEPSRSFPGLMTDYHELHVEAQLLAERLSVFDRLRLGLGDGSEDDTCDFTTSSARSYSGKMVTTYWVWENAAVWRMKEAERRLNQGTTSAPEASPDSSGFEPMTETDREAQREQLDQLLRDSRADSIPLACARMSKNLRSKLVELVDSDHKKDEALRSAISRALRHMFPEKAIELDLLFGGRSGSLVLTTTVKSWPAHMDDHERVATSCVVKVDRESDMKEEVEKTKQILPLLGENAPRVLGDGERYEKLDVTIDMGKRVNTHTIGTLAIELVGAAWVAPEFMSMGQQLMSTFAELYIWELTHASLVAESKGAHFDRPVFGEVPKVLLDLFGRSGLLTRVAARTATRSPDGNAWLGKLGLKERKKELSENWEKNIAWWCDESQDTVLETFSGLDALRWPDWAGSGKGGFTPVVSLVHADLHGQNILCDLRETTWVRARRRHHRRGFVAHS